MKQRGLFITFEGIDGAGKTTQLELLYRELRLKNFNVIRLREPGGTTVGERIRELLADKTQKVLPYTELLLFFASRVQLLEEVIKPELQNGKIILCDRFHDATVAYQGYGRGLNLDTVKMLEREFVLPLKPDRTFLLDCTYHVARKRLSTRGNKTRIEVMDKVFFERVRQGYLSIAKQDKDRVVVIDASNSIDKIKKQIRDSFYEWVKKFNI
ncbi:MAG: dTMP kinase [bacterium]